MVTVSDPETGEQSEKQSKRKLSKRKDPEANAAFYFEQGFPAGAVTEYLLNIANSDFEDWRRDNPATPDSEFAVKIDKLSPSGALADMVKLTSISKEVIARMGIEQLCREALHWARQYDKPLAALMDRDQNFTRQALEIVCGKEKPSKRIATWQDLRPQLGWFFDELFAETSAFDFPENVAPADRIAIMQEFLNSFDPADDRTVWFDKTKAVAAKLGFAAEMKEFKKNPQAFKGNIGDVTMVLRVAIAGMRQSPDLYDVIQLLGREKLNTRIGRIAGEG
jgi:glutamyl-tRNA synthetase